MIRSAVRRSRTAAPAVATPARRARLWRVLPGGLVTREWLVVAGRPRATAVKVLMPLVLTVPLVLGGAPTFWAGMLLTVLVGMVGAVGSAVTLARARGSGVLARLSVTPGRPQRLLAGWVVAGTSVDVLQTAPVLVVVLAAGRATPAAGVALVAITAAVLLAANTLGAALALLAGGPGDVLVDVGLVLAPLLYLGGLFTGVPRAGWRWTVAAADPFAHLHAAFIAALGGEPAFAAATVLLAAVGTALVALAGVVLLASALVERA